ncbi:hypothetical protein GQ457_16G013390 [Hibiscus cannabinus]
METVGDEVDNDVAELDNEMHPPNSTQETTQEDNYDALLKESRNRKVSRHTIKSDTFKTYEIEKRKLKDLLKTIDTISLTIICCVQVLKRFLNNETIIDVCIEILKDTILLTKRLICGGNLSHVHCCAHLLNIMVQNGLNKVKTIINNVVNLHESAC